MFEAALARYIIDRRTDVTAQMRTVASAAWSMVSEIDPARIKNFAETDATQPGAVGGDMAALRRVVHSGNLRETVAFLLAGQRTRVFRGLTEFRCLDSLEPQRAKRVHQPASLQRRWARNVHPPLSTDEMLFASRSAGSDGGFVAWRRGDQYISLPVSCSAHRDAEPTGGLVSTGLSGSTMVLLEIAKLAQDRGVRDIDLELVRLAAIAAFVEHGHHTVHEVLTSAQMWAAHANVGDKLTYDNSYRRYRSISPLTEPELRGVVPSSRFPDERMNKPDFSASAARHPAPAAPSTLLHPQQAVPAVRRHANEMNQASVRR